MLHVVLQLASKTATEILLKFQAQAAIITRSISRILAYVTERSEARTQLLSLISQYDGEIFSYFIDLIRTEWVTLDPVDRTDIVYQGFKALRQLTHGPGIVQRMLREYPNLILDISDLIMQNVSVPQVINQAKGLLYNYRAISRLPESLEVLIRDFEHHEPQIEVVTYV